MAQYANVTILADVALASLRIGVVVQSGGGGLLGAAEESAREVLELEELGAVAGDHLCLLLCGK